MTTDNDSPADPAQGKTSEGASTQPANPDPAEADSDRPHAHVVRKERSGSPAPDAAPDAAPHAEPDGDVPRGRGSIGRGALPDLETTEIVRGAKPGSRYARRVRAKELRFHHAGEGTLRATSLATAPRTLAGRLWNGLRRFTLGSPISSEHQEEQRLPKSKALAVFSSDALSSSAYATDEILLALAAAGTLALSRSVPIAIAIIALLAVVTFSYRQTIRAYPSGGGAYIVARDNWGDVAGITAAAGLSVGYIMTVAVSIAAGVFAVVSAFPELKDQSVLIAVLAVAVVTLLNLRGIRESGTIFAIPTYGFIIAFAVLIGVGFIRLALGADLHAETPESAVPLGTESITWFLILRAFSSGCAALTGVEAISNGIPAFKKPEPKNAQTTLVMMAAILGVLFIGITVLANELGVQHAEDISAPAQIAKEVFGENIFFYTIQAFTALILFLAANTAYADFPRLGSILARDKFLPHQFLFRGDRLAFSNGIIVLGAASVALLIIFNADVNRLIPLYAFGVFLSFTLSQGGMVVHWLRNKEPGWQQSLMINTVGATTTGVVAVIVGTTKFKDGAWIAMVAIAVLAAILWAIYKHYSSVERKLSVPKGAILEMRQHNKQAVLVPVDVLNRAILRTIDYARTISPHVTALHITDDVTDGQRLRGEWETAVLDVPMVIIDSPYRSFVAPVISYVDALDRVDPGQYVTVVLPEFVTPWPWQRYLHNQSARRLKTALLKRPNTVIIEVPYHLSIEGDAPELGSRI